MNLQKLRVESGVPRCALVPGLVPGLCQDFARTFVLATGTHNSMNQLGFLSRCQDFYLNLGKYTRREENRAETARKERKKGNQEVTIGQKSWYLLAPKEGL